MLRLRISPWRLKIDYTCYKITGHISCKLSNRKEPLEILYNRICLKKVRIPCSDWLKNNALCSERTERLRTAKQYWKLLQTAPWQITTYVKKHLTTGTSCLNQAQFSPIYTIICLFKVLYLELRSTPGNDLYKIKIFKPYTI